MLVTKEERTEKINGHNSLDYWIENLKLKFEIPGKPIQRKEGLSKLRKLFQRKRLWKR